MSGLCGIFDWGGAPVDSEALGAMARAAEYRGPDGISLHQSGAVGLAYLAFDRLPESTPQPLVDGRVVLVADVRIDNRDELLASLDGVSVESSDPELILAAYRRWGLDSPAHLIGDFAFALWDATERRLFCARDPLGCKTLCYARHGDHLLVATEAQQIVAHPSFPRRLDELTVAEFLVDAVRISERTFFQGVLRLMPAHRLVATADGLRIERYWDVDASKTVRYRRQEEYAEHFLELFERAVVSRLRTRDAAVGVAMSGGLDSTSVTAVAQRHLARVGGPRLVACSFVFPTLDDCDESLYIDAMTRELGLETEVFEGESSPILGDASVDTPYAESPLLNWEGIYHQIFERLRRHGASLLLGGLGGDNLYLGSLHAWKDRLRRGDVGVLVEAARHAWGLRGRPLALAIQQYALRPLKNRLRGGPAETSELLGPDWIAPRLRQLLAELTAEPLPRRFDAAASQRLYENIFLLAYDGRAMDWLERCGHRWGFETRHPHLDRRLVEFVLAIPPSEHYHPGWFKPLLRRSMAGLLPERVRQRRDKSNLEGFVRWSLRHAASERIARLLKAPRIVELGYVDGDRLQATFERFQKSGSLDDDVAQIWSAIHFEMWIGRFPPQD